jgi:two-component system chemotaxis response regulator CheY
MKKRILVVDDFTSIRDFVCETLQKKGYDTVSASNGAEAYKLLENGETVNLVLSDYNMPLCTGLELLKKIKSNTSTSKLPVIFLTTETDPGKMKTAKDAGLSAWIKKPYNAESFFAQLEKAMANG